MSSPELFRAPFPFSTTRRLAAESFEDMVKFVVDIERRILCAGGGLHSDEEQLLLEDGSLQDNLWGANYYLDDPEESRFEYTSMINVRPAQNNRAQQIESPEIRRHVRDLAAFFFESLK